MRLRLSAVPADGQLPEIILYEHCNYNRFETGWDCVLYDAVNLLDDACHRVKSAIVLAGRWRLWRSHDLQPLGDEGFIDLPPGDYPSLELVGRELANRAGWNAALSSLEPL
jgi:hypothetical protein